MSVRGRARTPWVLYFDGALRVNNAGPPGIGAVLKNSYGHVVATIKNCVDSTVSQNVAEYLALIAGLEKAKWLNVQHLVAKGDSLLVYNQVMGHWEVRDESFKPHWRKVTSLVKDFKSFRLEHIPREYNELADRLANQAVDEYLAKSGGVHPKSNSSALVQRNIESESDSDSDDSDDEYFGLPLQSLPRFQTPVQNSSACSVLTRQSSMASPKFQMRRNIQIVN